MFAKYIGLILIVLWGLSWMQTPAPDEKQPAFQYLTMDSVLLDVYEYEDSAGLPAGYTAFVRTPLCEDQLCYEAALDFYWDLLGNFTHYTVDPEEPLTKLDHVPFTPADYERLEQILLTKSPAFIHLRRSELIVEPPDGNYDEVDSRTGATVKAVKKDMVEGAIYTCYTLWHIANGGISFEIQEYTKQQLDEPLVRKLLASQWAAAHYFLLEHMEPRYFRRFLTELIDLAPRYDPFFIARLITKMPNDLFEAPRVQALLLSYFSRLEYTAQQELISKLSADIRLTESTLLFLIDQIQENATARNDQIIGLLCQKLNADNTDLLKNLFDTVHRRKLRLSPDSVESLRSLGSQNRSLKSRVRRLVRTHK